MSRLTPEKWRKVAGSKAVQAQTQSVARRIAARAQALNNAEGGTATISVVSGVRPKGRAFTNVVSDRPDEEHGTDKTARRAVLRRAANGG
ncbi:hypothetical protein SEA_TINALIN_17 [Gordonia phage TinaLin]|uniref:Head-to-tail connector protein n=1 Tax=Gordonia phage TinaLin TaxID=2797324 RepID=A0A7T7K7Y1_9CAUD|nr:head closure Hc1 [Gordonia phage TinaLin]QQM15106.1 hypothetical protein SEA_TINALIN_17 [Gordonia phage TinaLin]